MPEPVAAGAPPAVTPDGSFVFLSQLLGARVLGPAGERLGVLADMLAEPVAQYPRVRALRVRTSLRGELRRVEWDDVAACGPGQVRLKRGAEALAQLLPQPSEIPLAQDVLDRQIVDTNGAK